MRLAFLIPAPDYPDPWRWAFDAEASALRDSGVAVDPVPWTAAGDLSGFDLVLPLVAWGYHLRYAEWLAFLDRLERERLPVVNPPALLRWNSHKRYLAEFEGRGIPTVPTLFVEACSEADVAAARRRFASERLVIKPPVSGNADGTYRLEPGAPLPRQAAGRPTIIQPLLDSIAGEGEYSLMLFDGAFSHAVVKRPAAGDFRVQPHLGGRTEACAAPPGAVALAEAALAAAPAATSYARVDMVRGEDGALKIMELELVEPALFLDRCEGAAGRFAAAIRSAAERSGE